MTEKDLKLLYRTACDGKGYEGSDGQFKVWKQTLGWCEQADLAKALTEWFSSNSTFPMPAELKPLSEQARRQRLAKSQDSSWYFAWECPCCGNHTSGFGPENVNSERRCMSIYAPLGTMPRSLPAGQICGALLNLVKHEDTRTWKQEVSA